VAPVFEPGLTARQVYLPAGTWYEWPSGEALDGSRYVVAPTPMDRIPIYARGGAVIPMWPQAPASTAAHHPSVVELHVFVPRQDGVFRSFLQEDDGLTFAALEGARYRTMFTLTRDGDRIALVAEVEGAGYPEFAREAFHLYIHGADPDSVSTELAREGTHFVVPDSGTGFTIELRV
jgi:alpha-glucosidase